MSEYKEKPPRNCVLNIRGFYWLGSRSKCKGLVGQEFWVWKKCWVKKNVGSEKNVWPEKTVVLKKVFDPQKVLGPKQILGPKITFGKRRLCVTIRFFVCSFNVHFVWTLFVVLVLLVTWTPNPSLKPISNLCVKYQPSSTPLSDRFCWGVLLLAVLLLVVLLVTGIKQSQLLV